MSKSHKIAHYRTTARLLAVLAAAALAKGCGDADSPSAPPPDPPRPTTITVTPATADLAALGATVQLTAEVRDQNGNAMAGASVSWASSASAVATVSASGLVTAAGNGTATVTATSGSASGNAAVTVAQEVAAAAVTPSADTLVAGDTLRLAAEAGDANGHAVAGAEIAWASGDTAVARVDSAGLVTGISAGETTVTAASGSVAGEARLTVVENPDRAALVALYNATDGPNWVNNDNWLTDAPLGEWYGVSTDASGRVVRIGLGGRWDGDARVSVPHGLTGSIPSELGSLANLEDLYLPRNELTGPIPAELADLANLETLSLWNNELTGPIPPVLGNLANLERLDLGGNELTGPIPHSFLQLNQLRWFRIAENESLCVPGVSAFVAWLQRIENRDEASITCNASDVTALKSLFEAAGGADWTNSAGWLADLAVEEWHGVSADSLGHVTQLDLSRNGLAGRLPATLGRLAHLIELRIGDNPDLSGRLPLSLSGLSLRALHYAGTGLCAPVDASYREWLSAVPSHEGTGAECPPLSDREILEVLYDATGGPDWTDNENWLSDAPLGDWYGVDVDSDGRVTSIQLWANALAGLIPRELGGLSRLMRLSIGGTYNTRGRRTFGNGVTGRIPPELGDLSQLRSLALHYNNLTGVVPPSLGNLANLQFLHLGTNPRLTGEIPAELGNLPNLQYLVIDYSGLTGPIPPALANLANLKALILNNNDLTGSIPSALGRLVKLEELVLERNGLTGSIPGELGGLANLQRLDLGRNRLTGTLVPELGQLSQLTHLLVSNNALTGSLPDAFGGLTSLEQLELTNNAGMSGSLPSSLTGLGRLAALLADGTDLCTPANPSFLAWLEGVHKQRIASCAKVGVSPVYLTQSVQSREFPVPLVANRRALVRVFPTARETTAEGIPAVRASFYLNGTAVHTADIPAKATTIPTEVREGSLATSANAVIPASVVQPGLEMVVEIDPDGTLDAALGVTERIPETGRMAIDVRAMPTLDLTLVPFLWSEKPDSTILDIVEGLSPEDELFWMTRTLLPVGDFDLSAHEPVLSSSNHVSTLMHETEAIWVIEGRRGHYVGTIAGKYTGTRALGSLVTRVMFTVLGSSISDPEYVMAHELGHTMSLGHTPCGGAGHQDPSYPYSNGEIGAWGYDFRDGGSLVAPHNRDLMSYCGAGIWWISDYHFTNALRYRLADEGSPTGAAAATANKSLLLWGGADSEGEPYLEPAFVVDAPPAMPETADGAGSSSFAFALPVRTGWEGNLASISLTGPGGSATLDGDSDIPMVILRNPRNGQVRGILRDLSPPTQTAMDAVGQAAGPGLDVLFSRGIPEAEAWRR